MVKIIASKNIKFLQEHKSKNRILIGSFLLFLLIIFFLISNLAIINFKYTNKSFFHFKKIDLIKNLLLINSSNHFYHYFFFYLITLLFSIGIFIINKELFGCLKLFKNSKNKRIQLINNLLNSLFFFILLSFIPWNNKIHISYLWLSLITFLFIIGNYIFLFYFFKIKFKNSISYFINSIFIFILFAFLNYIIAYGFWLIVFIIFLITILTDISCWFFGSLLGKNHCFSISKNKTLEGLIYGCFNAIVLSTIFLSLLFFLSPILNKNLFTKYDFICLISFLIIFVIFASFFEQSGDLYFSFLKRKAKIKDFSNLLKSHGGLLDRLDGFIFISLLMLFIFIFISI